VSAITPPAPVLEIDGHGGRVTMGPPTQRDRDRGMVLYLRACPDLVGLTREHVEIIHERLGLLLGRPGGYQ